MRSQIIGCILLLSLTTLPANAHFQTLIPSTDILNDASNRELQLELQFTHPMNQGPAMEMAKPMRFGVINAKGPQDLLDELIPYQVDGHTAYQATYPVQSPGDLLFYVEPAPYWEADEQKLIVHYTKVLVDAFAGTARWQQQVGFPVEIDPLTRPYGLWRGNQFRGVVLKHGKAVPFATVEVEWLNDGSINAPADAFVTQQLKADANGTFSYVMPRAGWWGFAALIDGDEPMPNPDGQPVAVELGAVIWVHSREMQ